MKNIIGKFIGLFFIVLLATSCEKEYSEFYSDNRPEIPVTFPGAVTHGFNPYKTVSIGSGDIEFTIEIPANSGRSISQITKITGGATALNAASLRNNTANYISAPISGNGNTAVFSTTLSEFASKSSANAELVQVGAEIAFMFLIRLDNDQEIIPVQARIRITE